MNLEENLKKYAELLVRSGLNVQKDQIVVVQAPIEAYQLVREIVEKSYEIGASDVIVRYKDEVVDHIEYMHKTVEELSTYADFNALMYNSTAKAGACYLMLIGDDPDLMSDVDSKKISAFSKAKNEATPDYRNGRQFMKNSWCIAAVSSQKWAEKVYPNDSDSYMKLWDAIFKVARVYGNSIENWENHKQSFFKKMEIMNSMKISSLHYSNSLGTDFTVKMNKGYQFVGGGSYLENGNYYFPNMPTEELFSCPNRLSANGKLVASKPLCYNGSMIEDFWFTFKDGKVVDFDARIGKDVLQSIMDIDENASYLGEVALVPYDSPISNLNTIFYETLLDENAACHFALGTSFAECIEGGLEMSEEELLKNGMNQSLTHVDFMIGTKDLSVVATCEDGKKVPIFVNGNFSSIFD